MMNFIISEMDEVQLQVSHGNQLKNPPQKPITIPYQSYEYLLMHYVNLLWKNTKFVVVYIATNAQPEFSIAALHKVIISPSKPTDKLCVFMSI